MRLYRFSPIASERWLYEVVEYLHGACHELSKLTFGRYLPVRGNVGIFAHYEEEFAYLAALKDELTAAEQSYKQKYFKLRKPIVVPSKGDVPGATYDFLYIRRVDPYRSQVGDIDFVLPAAEHGATKTTLNLDTFVKGARLFGRPEEDITELWHPDIDAIAYAATGYMRDEVTTAER